MKTIYYTEDGLAERIREIREMRELSLEREEELTILYHAIQGKVNCVIDNNGKLVHLGPEKKKKQSAYELNKPREPVLHPYRERMMKRLVWET